MRFEWDDEKARANIEKHGVTFGEATEVFYDPNVLEGDDPEHSIDEARFFVHRLLGSSPVVRRLRREAWRRDTHHLGAPADAG